MEDEPTCFTWLPTTWCTFRRNSPGTRAPISPAPVPLRHDPDSVTADFDWSIQEAPSVPDGGSTVALLTHSQVFGAFYSTISRPGGVPPRGVGGGGGFFFCFGAFLNGCPRTKN